MATGWYTEGIRGDPRSLVGVGNSREGRGGGGGGVPPGPFQFHIFFGPVESFLRRKLDEGSNPVVVDRWSRPAPLAPCPCASLATLGRWDRW